MSTELPVVRVPDDADTNATLSLISQARRSLAEARTLPDIRRVMEAASVAADAAARAAKLAEAQQAAAEVVDAANEAANDAAAVRIEAQARAGELLRQMAEQGERTRPGDTDGRRLRPSPNLSQLGVTKSDSSRWQQVASVPGEVRQEYLDATRAARQEVSTAGLLRHAHGRGDGQRDRPRGGPRRGSIDHPAIAAEARKRMRTVYRGLVDLPCHRPEALVAALDRTERRTLLRALGQLPAWIEDVRRELDVHRVGKEE
jgi:hypothetical protein